MTVADAHLAEIGPADFDAWDYEHGSQLIEQARTLPDAARQAHLLYWAARPLVHFMISLPVHGLPGAELARDATTSALAALNRRTVHAYRCAGINGRFAKRNLRLLDRICSLIGQWPEPEWTATARRRVEQLAKAKRRGRERGQRLRNARPERDRAPKPPHIPWMLCHPNDHWFRRASPSIIDPVIAAAIDEWIAEFAPSYATLAGADWRAEESSADVVIDIQLHVQITPDWNEPLPATVDAQHRGSIQSACEVRLHQVPVGDGPFNGTLLSVLPHERWRVCGSLLADRSIVPEDGTRRLAWTNPGLLRQLDA